MGELDAMLGKDLENPSRKDNTVGKRIKDATAAYEGAKISGEGLSAATNTPSDAIEKLLAEAANRATWYQRQTSSNPARQLVTLNGKMHGGAEIPKRRIKNGRHCGWRSNPQSPPKNSETN